MGLVYVYVWSIAGALGARGLAVFSVTISDLFEDVPGQIKGSRRYHQQRRMRC